MCYENAVFICRIVASSCICCGLREAAGRGAPVIGDKGYTLECTYFNECSVPIKFDFMYGEVADVPVGGKYTRNSVGLGCFPDHPFKPYRWFKLYCGDYRVDVIDGRNWSCST